MVARSSRIEPTLYVVGLATMALVFSFFIFEAFEFFKHTHDIADLVGIRFKLNPMQQKILQAALLWISSIIMLCCFYLKEGTTLWRHIARNKCFNVERHAWLLMLCAMPRVAVTLFFAPLVIGAGLVKAMISKSKLVEVGFVTLNPHYLFTMTKHLISVTALLCVLLSGAIHLKPIQSEHQAHIPSSQ
jgi:hypothetical protein